jgi:hypothetical protein
LRSIASSPLASAQLSRLREFVVDSASQAVPRESIARTYFILFFRKKKEEERKKHATNAVQL